MDLKVFSYFSLFVTILLTLPSCSSDSITSQDSEFPAKNKALVSANVAKVKDPGKNSRRPNVIIILVDTLRYDTLGISGYDKNTTPFIDGFFNNGVVFESAYSQAPSTLISTASLMSGRFFPLMGKIPERERYQGLLSLQNDTIAEVLGASGYENVGIFTNPNHTLESEFKQGFSFVRYLKRAPKAHTRAETVNSAFVEWFKSRNESKPFFAYLHYMDVHHPYSPLPEFDKKFVTQKAKYKYMGGIPTGDKIPNPVELRYLKELYDSELLYVDSMVKNLCGFIEANIPNEETIIIFASDHGEEFMDHGGLGHGRTHELELLHVPLMIHGVKDTERGRIREVVRNVDIAPTITELVGIRAPSSWDGTSLARRISAPSRPDNLAQDSYAHRGRNKKLRSITNDEWHFIWNIESNEKKLYDIRSDPAGLYNVISDHTSIANSREIEMFRFLEKIITRTNNFETSTDYVSVEVKSLPEDSMNQTEVEEQMRALGYLE